MNRGGHPSVDARPALPVPDFRIIFESGTAAAVLMLADDPVFTIVAVSDQYQRLTGVAGKNLIGCGVFEAFPENPDVAIDGMAAIKASFLRVISTRASDRLTAQRYDVQRSPEDGGGYDERYWDFITSPVKSVNGQVEFLLHSVEEVTEKVLAARRDVFDRSVPRLLAQIPAAIAVLRGPQHLFEWVNDEFVRLTVSGAQTELVGKTFREALPELASQGYVAMLDRVFETGEPHEAREAVVRLGKAERRDSCISFVCLATRDVQGAVNGTFFHATNVTDLITARKDVEESEQQFLTLAETIPHLAWVADGGGRIFWYNRRWYDYTGATFEEMKGWGWEKVHDPEVLPDVRARWTEAIETGQSFEMVFPLKGVDGTFRPFLTRIEPVKDSAGRVVRWFGTNTDITEQRKTEEELRRINRELEEFAYVASHDLREPLRMVNVYTQLLLKRFNLEDEKLNQYGRFVTQGVNRMETLVEDLLMFSRTVQGNEMPAGAADLAQSLSEALDLLKNAIDECGAKVTAPRLPAVHGDTKQLAHVFQNLVSNSLKYCRPGSTPEIDISAVQRGREWIISIRDNGIGFEQQYADQIFGLFKRLHKDEYPGTGLGLAICRRIVERYGGRIWAEGRPGEGAAFYFTARCADVNQL